MTEIYLIRHAQAEGNLYRIMQGHWDGELTELGMLQAEALGRRFEGVRIDAVYTSDLRRTVRTAAPIASPRGLEPVRLSELREIGLGPWETMFFGNLFYDEPEAAEKFINDPERWSLDGAETFRQVGDRAYAALEEIAREHEGQSVAVVSHGVTIRCLLSRICGIPLSETKKLPIGGNTAVSRLLWHDGRFAADYINDSGHLNDLPAAPWHAVPDMRHVVFDPASDPDYYISCYRDSWTAAHGDDANFTPEPYLSAAIRHHAAAPGSVLKIYAGDEPAGLVDMDPQRGAHAGYGWISLLYLKPRYRYKGAGVQLLARPISFYSGLGRRALRLHVAEANAPALAFYRRWDFHTLGTENTVRGRLLLMEKKLGAQWYA